MSKATGPKILFADIETLPLEVYTWGIWDVNVGINQIKHDWTVLSWSAKWQGSNEVLYEDVRGQTDLRNDALLLRGIWRLLDKADIVIWQNGKSFDHKKLNARFLLNGFKPPSPYKQIDTKQLASRHFAMTSNKLEFLAAKLNKKHLKSDHRKFVGFDLWKECMANNPAAFKEMEKYNRADVLALEELYNTLQAWDRTVDFNLYRSKDDHRCNCGSQAVQRRGLHVTTGGKFRRYQCSDCGAWTRGKDNLLSKEKRSKLRPAAKG